MQAEKKQEEVKKDKKKNEKQVEVPGACLFYRKKLMLMLLERVALFWCGQLRLNA